jgi:heterodisulfide reductase subunit B
MTTKDKYKKVAYYPGCALEGTGHAYNRSTKAVGKKLGLDLVEVKDWNCCGAMEVKNIDPKIQTYLSSRVMSTAANEMDMDVVMAPCNGCYHNLKKAEYDLANDEESVEVPVKESGAQDLRVRPGRDHSRARLDKGFDRRGRSG